jgi:transcriptional regulator with XRE-family HTH domain
METIRTKKEIGSKIRELREKRGYSQQKLAELAGYTDKSVISKIEAGKIDLTYTQILKFSKLLGVTPSGLFGEDTDESDLEFRNAISLLSRKYNEADDNGRARTIGLLGVICQYL